MASGKINSSDLTQTFNRIKIKNETKTVNRLNTYVSENRKIMQPEVPQPYIVKNFSFCSRVGQK